MVFNSDGFWLFAVPMESLVPHAVTDRVVKRQEFDKESQDRSEEMEKMREDRIARKEQEEAKQLRQKTKFVARPIRKYRRFSIRFERKATKAVSPKFSERLNCVDVRKCGKSTDS